MPQTRIPTEADFAPLSPALTVSLVAPDPPESTTAILLLFHGLGDSHAPFAGFARSLALPGVLAVSVRGVAPLPPALLADNGLSDPTAHFHWGDDLVVSSAGDGLEPDPGFEKAVALVLRRLVGEVLVARCGWDTADILLFGFGQGGSLALGLASRLRMDGDGAGGGGGTAFKGVVSVGGPLLASTIPSESGRGKARTPVLVFRGSESEDVDDGAVEVIESEFADAKVVTWKRPDDGMPRSREEVLPMMQFFAERLQGGW